MEIYILGIGNNTPVYIDLVEECGFKIAALLHYNDERIGEEVLGYPIIDSNEGFFKKNSLNGLNFAISVGENKIRRKLAKTIRDLGGNIPTLIHPSAVVSKYAEIAKGVVIHANSVVQAGAKIGQDSVLSYNTSLTHTSRIGKFCYIAFGSTIGAYVTIEDNVFIGQSAVIVSGKVNCVGENSIVGAGSIVTKNVEKNTTVMGSPARKIINLDKR